MMKKKILIWLCKNWKKNKDKDYPQTWFYISKFKRFKHFQKIKRFLQWLCVVCGGHELSNTEWGYGGGKFADGWCRWCNKMIQVPKESMYFRFKDMDARGLMKKVGKKFDG